MDGSPLAAHGLTSADLDWTISDEGRVYRRAQYVKRLMGTGMTATSVAERLSIERRRALRSNDGGPTLGTAISRQSVSQYKLAWETVERSGLNPTPRTVSAAFTMVCKAFTADGRESLIARMRRLPETDRAEAFIHGCSAVVKAAYQRSRNGDERSPGHMNVGPEGSIDVTEILRAMILASEGRPHMRPTIPARFTELLAGIAEARIITSDHVVQALRILGSRPAGALNSDS